MLEIKKKQVYVGRHINTRCGFTTCVQYANSIGANVFQIFLASPYQYNAKRHTSYEIKQLRVDIEKNNMKVVVHANYMLNFCNPIDTSKHKLAIKLLVHDLKESVKLGALGVIIHMGKKLDMNEDEAIANYVKGVKNTLKQTPDGGTIIFETGAGQGTEVCTSIFDLSKLYNKFTESEKARIKFCIDTCHIFAAGYNIGSSSYVDIYDQLIEDILGWNNISCIHFNDSKCPLNCRKDRHADIGKGCIKIDGLKKFFKICCKRNIPLVLETPCEGNVKENEQLKMVRSWLNNK